ncbi:MAG: hypothetical protein AB7N65_14685 [Vicinamibacterales bacterium]
MAHLAGCPSCRADLDALRQLRARTKAAFLSAAELQPRPEFAAQLAQRLHTLAATSPRPGLSRRRWLAVAAGATVAAGAGWSWRAWSEARLAALLHAVAGDHRNCALTFALDEPPIPLEEAARRFGGAYGRLRNLEPSPSVIQDGAIIVVDRHSCVFGGQRFSHIVLRYRDTLVSVLVTDRVSRDLQAEVVSRPSSGDLQIATIGADETVFVVSSLSRNDVEAVGRAVAEPLRRALAGD